MMRTIIVASLLTVLCGLEPAAGSAQTFATFRSSVDLVPISAIVRDGRGRLVTTLTTADFDVTDNGESRPIVDFQVDQTSPITIAVLVDMSGSMRIGPKLEYTRQVLTQLNAELADGRDEVGLFTFDAALHEQQPFSRHPASLNAALATSEPFGSTSLYDAVAAMAHQLELRPSARRAIIVVTDGVDTSSRLTAPEVSGLASSIDVPVYVVLTVLPIERTRAVDRAEGRTSGSSTADLGDLAQWTGGDVIWASAGDEAAVGTHHILTELRHQYLLAIESATQSEWRPLAIHVRDRHLTVRARSGYFSQETPLSR